MSDQIEPFLHKTELGFKIKLTKEDNEFRESNCCSNFLEEDNSFFIFSKSSIIRKLCINIMKMPFFDNMILLTILLNCITLALERPNIDSDSFVRNNFLVYDYSEYQNGYSEYEVKF